MQDSPVNHFLKDKIVTDDEIVASNIPATLSIDFHSRFDEEQLAFYTVTDIVTVLVNVEREVNILQDAILSSYMSCLLHTVDRLTLNCDPVIFLR